MSDGLNSALLMSELCGERLDDAGARRLREQIPTIPGALIALMTDHPLMGTQLSIAEEDNPSGIGVELEWLNVDGILDEALQAYPGIVALKLGYIPIGGCQTGTGDPYFFRASDGAIVRIYHDACTESELGPNAVDLIATSVEELLRLAVVSPPR